MNDDVHHGQIAYELVVNELNERVVTKFQIILKKRDHFGITASVHLLDIQTELEHSIQSFF